MNTIFHSQTAIQQQTAIKVEEMQMACSLVLLWLLTTYVQQAEHGESGNNELLS